MEISAPLNRPILSGEALRFGRLVVFLIPLFLTFANYLLENRFTNWEFLAPNLAILCAAFAFHTGYFFIEELLERNKVVKFATFIIDSAFLTLLIFWTGIDQSFYLFLYLILVLVCGLEMRTWFAVTLALLVSIEFTTLSLMYKNLGGVQFLFFVVINDASLFIVAFLSGYLADNLKDTTVSLVDLQKLNAFVVDSSPVGLVTLNSKFQILQINAAGKTFLGSQSDQVLGILRSHVLGVQGADIVNFEFTIPSKTEERIFKATATKRWSELLQEQLFLVNLEDQTQIKKLEWDLRQKEKLAAVGQLAAGIAHEIRNPLASMSGSIELLSQQTTNEDDKKLMKIILREIDRLNNLIGEFLDYSRPAKRPTETISLSNVLNELIDALKFNPAFTSEVKLDVRIIENLKMIGFPDKLKQAFLNIIINSLQALDNRPEKKISVTTEVTENFIKVVVEDSGIGMNSETLKRMFEPFHTTKTKGTGLGLAITHKIIELHGGQIFVESFEGRGTRFEIKFPC